MYLLMLILAQLSALADNRQTAPWLTWSMWRSILQALSLPHVYELRLS